MLSLKNLTKVKRTAISHHHLLKQVRIDGTYQAWTVLTVIDGTFQAWTVLTVCFLLSLFLLLITLRARSGPLLILLLF